MKKNFKSQKRRPVKTFRSKETSTNLIKLYYMSQYKCTDLLI